MCFLRVLNFFILSLSLLWPFVSAQRPTCRLRIGPPSLKCSPRFRATASHRISRPKTVRRSSPFGATAAAILVPLLPLHSQSQFHYAASSLSPSFLSCHPNKTWMTYNRLNLGMLDNASYFVKKMINLFSYNMYRWKETISFPEPFHNAHLGLSHWALDNHKRTFYK